ncbi:hypothetical protein ACIHFD_49515 [Nonomuraea sp. NPDC051941]|uniref:hypothetical protein n=1 Tax=Nonomuraea sp. NPDC051941 TaxID=3364373 RepID=UPI0037C6ED3F
MRRCVRAVEWQEDGRYECRNCGRRLATNDAGALEQPVRHAGEPRRSLTPAAADAAAFARAIDLGEHAAAQLPDISSRDEIVRAVVEDLYRAGMLRRTPARSTTAA